MRIAGATKTFALVLLLLAAGLPALVGVVDARKGRMARFVSLYDDAKRDLTGELGALSATPVRLIVHGHEAGLLRPPAGASAPKGFAIDPGGFLVTEKGEALWDLEAGRPIQVGVLWAGVGALSAICAALALIAWLAALRVERVAREAEAMFFGADAPEDGESGEDEK
jgi:hypothetical protein